MEQKGPVVPLEEYQALLKLLEEERLNHAATKQQLIDLQDKLDFANGEIEILQKQVQREKRQFEQSFEVLKKKALKDSSKKTDLENKYQDIEKQNEQTIESMSKKEHLIQDLSEQLQNQRSEYQHQLEELNIRLQQEAYIAREFGLSSNNSNKKIGRNIHVSNKGKPKSLPASHLKK